MTDNEIIKALECCGKYHTRYREQPCEHCPFNSKAMCIAYLIDNTIGFINRQKAEINKLTYQVNRLKKYDEERDIRLHARLTATARADAIKEFAERLKNASGSAVAVQDGRELYETKSYTINAMKLDNLVEEMAGES